MKKLLLTGLLLAALLPARAQLFSSSSLGGALWGSLVGGLVGGDCRRGFSGEGAAIGAGVGLLAGAIAGAANRNYHLGSSGYVYAPAPTVSFGYGYGHCGSSAYSASQPQVPPAARAPNQITSKPCATSTYHWTPRPPIADAPRVPDAPTF